MQKKGGNRCIMGFINGKTAKLNTC